MAIWQATDGSLHDDMGGAAQSLPIWPQGMTLLTQAQADAVIAAQAAAAQAAAALLPDPNGFTSALKAAMGGIVGANALMISYPAFFPAVQQQDWVDVQALIIDANTTAKITSTQYIAFKAAATQFNIPVVLP